MTANGTTNGGSSPLAETAISSRFEARWHIVGAGLSNVWQFGDLDLLIPTGRLLLRGRNGAGKTTALEAIAPYLLDLNPAKMAAGKSRTTNLTSLMREGAAGKRRYGYVWLTFAEKQEGIWSFGVRLQYSDGASPPVKVTPFVAPGRPLHDLLLHGPARAALSSEQFAERVVGCGGEIFDLEEAYVSHLAARVFGRADASEITALASRLRQIRNPTLLGDVSPQAAADALRESLPGVDEGVVTATADALAESDATRTAFNRDSEAAHVLEEFRQTWYAHVTEVVARSHNAASAAERERRAQIAKVKENDRALERASTAAAAAKAEAELIDTQVAEARAEIAAIEKHEDYRQAGRLIELKRTAVAQRQAASSAVTMMRKSAEHSAAESMVLERTLQSIAEDLEDIRREVSAVDPEAGISESLLSWTVHRRASLRAGDTIVDCGAELQIHTSPTRLREIADSWLQAAEKRTQLSEAAVLAITDYRDAARLEVDANQKEQAARRATENAESESAKAKQAELESDRAARTLLAAMHAWLVSVGQLLEELNLAADEHRESLQAGWGVDDIDRLASAEPVLVLGTCDTVAQEVVSRAEEIAAALRSRAAQSTEEATRLRQNALILRKEAEDLRAGRLLPLPRPDWAGPGDDSIALGGVLEWQHGFEEPKERALVEAAVSAAGLLGASVGENGISTSYWQVQPTGPVCSENLGQVISVDITHPLSARAAAILPRIRLTASTNQLDDSATASLCIGRDGTFRAGVLNGRIPGTDNPSLLMPATHIGARQRRLAALERAQQLEHQADALEGEALEHQRVASLLDGGARRISASARAVPSRDDLRTKESQRGAFAEIAKKARNAAVELEAASQKAAREFQSAHIGWLERTRSRGLPGDLEQLNQLRTQSAHIAATLRRAAAPVAGKLTERLAHAITTHSPDSISRSLQEAEATAKSALREAADAQTEVQVLEETAGAAIAEIQARHVAAGKRLSSLRLREEPAKQAWIKAEREEASAQESVDEARKHLREEIEPHARQQLTALRALLDIHGVADSVLDGEPVADEAHLLEQIATKTQNRRTLTVKTVLEKVDFTRTKLAGVWSLDPGENHGELLTFVLRYRDGTYTPNEAAAYAQRLKARAEAALAASEERALRDFVIGRLPNAIGTAWTRLRDWVVEVNRKMQSAAASSGVGVQVRIPLRDDLPPACREVYELSCATSSAERTIEQQQQLGRALRALIDAAPGDAMQDRVAYAVDIREWVEVHYEVTRPAGKKQRWNSRTGLSGGERRLVVLAPMLAAIAAGYDRLGSKVLRLVTLDEVPAEVDERGREGLARYIAALDLDLICTSYLWDGAPGAWDGIDAYDLEAAEDGTVVGFPMLIRGASLIPEPGDPPSPSSPSQDG